MSTDTMQLTNFHLGRSKKLALQDLAKAKGTKVADELRKAVDAYLDPAGVSSEEVQLLQVASKQFKKDFDEMVAMVSATNRKADAVFAELEKVRGAPIPGAEAASGATKAKSKRGAH